MKKGNKNIMKKMMVFTELEAPRAFMTFPAHPFHRMIGSVQLRKNIPISATSHY